jgi:hypothetical protein
MSYEEVFVTFWEQVKISVEEGRLAKLTMAKTIGKLELKNIFLRPVYSEDGFKVLLKLRYRSREKDDIETEMSLNEAFDVLKEHLKKPFFTVILFTITEDVTFKINKKGVGSISTNVPTFTEVTEPKMDEE